MQVPHFLKLLKYRVDFVLHYVRAFTLFPAVRTLYLTRFSRLARGELVKVCLDQIGTTIYLRIGTSDVDAFEKIFVWKEYDLNLAAGAEAIIDCGANIGLSALWFAKKYPMAKVIALEPDSQNYALLVKNTSTLENVAPISGGVWNSSCSLIAENPEAGPDSFRFVKCARGIPGSVRAYDIGSLLSEYRFDRLDILKIDIEGGEEALFSEGYVTWLERTTQVIIELHGAKARRAVEKAMSGRPYRHFIAGENDVFVRDSK